MKDKRLDESITEVLETIARADDERHHHDLSPLEFRQVFVDELADELRFEWKEELDSELRERAKRGFFTERKLEMPYDLLPDPENIVYIQQEPYLQKKPRCEWKT